MKTIYILFISLIFFSFSCKPTSNTNEESTDTSETQFTLTAFTPSAEFEDAEIVSMNYTDGTFQFGIAGETYELGVQTPDAPQKMCANSAEGQHIHLIDGTAPYAAKYTSDFDYELSDGEHTLLAFLSRSYHESIKTDKAYAAQWVNIENGSIISATDIDVPMIFYSRPKGTYVGDDTKRVMLDFYLVNCDLGPDYSVKAEINGEIHMIDTWQPSYIEGMPMGENTIQLTLLDGEGNPVDVEGNPVERAFTLVAEPES